MKAIKPTRLGLIQRVVEHRRRCTLAVSVLVYQPLVDAKKLLSEMTLWKDVGEHVPGGVLDEGFPKPRGEVLLSGCGYAPEGQPTGAVMVRLRLGDRIDKQLAVIGDRHWKNGTPSEPRPFERMPIDYAHAFGGEGYELNPTGKGLAAVETEHGPVHYLPNIELPDRLIVSKQDRPPPGGFGAYDVMWPQRFAKVGKRYDGEWLAKLFPGPAEDFDASFYNAAPEDQHLDGFFAGNESFVLEGMHPTKPRIAGRLEPLVVRAFLTQPRDGEEQFTELATRLDTVHLLPHLERAVLVFRATHPVEADDADDVEHIVIGAESPDHPKSAKHYYDVLHLRLDKDKGALASLRDEDLLPPAVEGWSASIDVGEIGEMTKIEQLVLTNMGRGRDRKLAELDEIMREAGFDPDELKPELDPEPPAPADPYDIESVIEYTEKMKERAAAFENEAEATQQKMQAELRRAFEEEGYDYDEEITKAEEQAGGPPRFSADEHLMMLHDLSRIAYEGGQPMEDLDRSLTDPQFEETLRELEQRAREGYRLGAHYLPPAPPLDADRAQLLRVQVAAARDSGEGMAAANLTCADLSGLDLSGINLSGAFLEGVNLMDACLAGADLSDAILARANLSGADLTRANLRGANVGDATLIGTNLTDSDLHKTVFGKSILDGARLSGARLEETDFIETLFGSVDFSGVQTEAVLFLQADLSRASFGGARLHQARFIECDLERVDFSGADLSRAQMITVNADGACFVEAKMHATVFVHGSSLVSARFGRADLTSANLRGTPMAEAELEGARLDGADLSKCDLRGANMHRVRARSALMMRTDFTRADLRGADFLGAIVQKAVLRGADLRGANLSRADLSLVRVDAATKSDDALMLDTRVEPQHDGS